MPWLIDISVYKKQDWNTVSDPWPVTMKYDWNICDCIVSDCIVNDCIVNDCIVTDCIVWDGLETIKTV